MTAMGEKPGCSCVGHDCAPRLPRCGANESVEDDYDRNRWPHIDEMTARSLHPLSRVGVPAIR